MSRFPSVRPVTQPLSVQSVQGSVDADLNFDDQYARKPPAFHIVEPNPLMGNKTVIMINSEMSRSLCEFIESTPMPEGNGHLWALAKKLRTHYFRMGEMFDNRVDMANNRS